VFKDSVNSATISAIFPYNSLAPTYNPDNDNLYNYGSRFIFDDQNYGTYTTETITTPFISYNTGQQNCHANCMLCFGPSNAECIQCQAGYAMKGSVCIKSNSGNAYYYFSNPGTAGLAKFSLNISSLSLASKPSITIFMFLKIFGFTKTAANKKILILDSLVDLYFDPTTYGLIFEYNGTKQFAYPNFQQSLFGVWVPISIALFRSATAAVIPNLNSLSIDKVNLECLDTSYPSIPVTEISFPNGFIGYVSDVTIYSTFIINAWGIAMQ
jgi:hypothetical protein